MYIATGKDSVIDITSRFLKGILKKNHPSTKEWQMTNAFLMRKNGCGKANILKKTNQMKAKYQQSPVTARTIDNWLKRCECADKNSPDVILKGKTPKEFLNYIIIDKRIKLSYRDVQKVRKRVKGKKLSDTQLAKKILKHTGTKVSKGYARKNRSKFGANPLFVRK